MALLTVAVVANALLLRVVILRGGVSIDFIAYWQATVRLLHGVSPYHQSPWLLTHALAFAYPALATVVFVPFGWLSLYAGSHVYMVASIVLVPLTLWILKVRDWRIYAAVSLWAPFEVGWSGGNVSIQFAFILAVIWRCRERPFLTGLLCAAAISIKPFAWPVVIFLIATRRWRATGWTIAWGAALNLLAWAIVGPSQIAAFLHDTSVMSQSLWRVGYSVTAATYQLGGGRILGEALMALISAALVCAVLRTGWRGHERGALALTVALMLVASPIVWTHYFMLLIVPLAISRPRLTLGWLAPIAIWLCPPAFISNSWEIAIAWWACVMALAPLIRPPRVDPERGRLWSAAISAF